MECFSCQLREVVRSVRDGDAYLLGKMVTGALGPVVRTGWDGDERLAPDEFQRSSQHTGGLLGGECPGRLVRSLKRVQS